MWSASKSLVCLPHQTHVQLSRLKTAFLQSTYSGEFLPRNLSIELATPPFQNQCLSPPIPQVTFSGSLYLRKPLFQATNPGFLPPLPGNFLPRRASPIFSAHKIFLPFSAFEIAAPQVTFRFLPLKGETNPGFLPPTPGRLPPFTPHFTLSGCVVLVKPLFQGTHPFSLPIFVFTQLVFLELAKSLGNTLPHLMRDRVLMLRRCIAPMNS